MQTNSYWELKMKDKKSNHCFVQVSHGGVSLNQLLV